MWKCIDPQNNEYRLTIEYKGKELTYKTKMIQSVAGEQLWFLWAKRNGKDVILQFYYYTARKELKQAIVFGQPLVPVEFHQVIEQAFQQKK